MFGIQSAISLYCAVFIWMYNVIMTMIYLYDVGNKLIICTCISKGYDFYYTQYLLHMYIYMDMPSQ